MYKPLILICLLAFGLRFAAITYDSLWLDEAYQTLSDAFGQAPLNLMNFEGKAFLFQFHKPHSLHEVMQNFGRVDPISPPLYPLVLNRWMASVGTSDLKIRLLSVIFSVSSIVALYLTARKFFGANIALMAALLQAISPFDIYYAQEARMYSLVVLLSVISCGSLFSVFREHITSRAALGWLVPYVVSTWALINAHYTGLFIWAFEIVFSVAWCIRTKQARLFACLSLSWVMIFLIWLPWFDLFRQASEIRKSSFYVNRVGSWQGSLRSLFVRIPLNWIVFLAGKRVVAWAVPLYLTSATMLALGFVHATRMIIRKNNQGKDKATPKSQAFFHYDASPHDQTSFMKQDKRHGRLPPTLKDPQWRGAYVAFLSWCILPALILWVIDTYESRKVVEITRYVIGTSPAVYVIAAIGLLRFGQPIVLKAGTWALYFIVLHAACALGNTYYCHIVPQREPWRQMASIVESLCAEGDLILVSQYYDILCLDRYLTRPFRQVGVSPQLGQQKINDIIEGFPNLKQFWLITAQEGESVVQILPPKFRITRQIDLAHGLHLRLYVR